MIRAATNNAQIRHLAIGGMIALTGHMAFGYVVMTQKTETTRIILDPVFLVDLPPSTPENTTLSPEPQAEPVNPVKIEAAAPVPTPPKPAPQPTYEPPPTPVKLPAEPVYPPPPAEALQDPVMPETVQIQPQLRLADPEPRVNQTISNMPREQFAREPVKHAINSAPAQPVQTTTDANQLGSTKARAEKADYYADLSLHLNRRKKYPRQARKARQEGIVKIRFTVDQKGNVTNVSIKESSGHELLDDETIALLKRVAPLPSMPKSMTQSSLTITLPIEYSLRTR